MGSDGRVIPQHVRQAIFAGETELLLALASAGGKATARANRKRAAEQDVRDASERVIARREHKLQPWVQRRDDLVEDL